MDAGVSQQSDCTASRSLRREGLRQCTSRSMGPRMGEDGAKHSDGDDSVSGPGPRACCEAGACVRRYTPRACAECKGNTSRRPGCHTPAALPVFGVSRPLHSRPLPLPLPSTPPPRPALARVDTAASSTRPARRPQRSSGIPVRTGLFEGRPAAAAGAIRSVSPSARRLHANAHALRDTRAKRPPSNRRCQAAIMSFEILGTRRDSSAAWACEDHRIQECRPIRPC
jgi:hypothetical protein